MKYLSKVMDLDWLGKSDKSQTAETPSEDPRKNKSNKNDDVSVAHFEDEGGIYLLSFDWTIDEIQEFIHKSDFINEWERQMPNTGLCVISGKIGEGEDIEIVHTSVNEVFCHEESDK